MTQSDHPRLRLTPNWRASLLALLLMPILLSLGFWQLDRAEEKRQLQQLFAQRQAAGPLAINQLKTAADLRYQPVSLQGNYLNDKTLYLDNKIYQRRFGYEIISLFKLAANDQLVLVNRGWLQGDSARRTLPAVQAVEGMVELQAEVYVPQGEMLVLAPDQQKGWPRVVQSVNPAMLEGEFDQPLFPYTVRLKTGSEGSLQPNWVVVNLQPEKHTGYAVQWFAMSTALLMIMLLANTNLWARLTGRKQ